MMSASSERAHCSTQTHWRSCGRIELCPAIPPIGPALVPQSRIADPTGPAIRDNISLLANKWCGKEVEARFLDEWPSGN